MQIQTLHTTSFFGKFRLRKIVSLLLAWRSWNWFTKIKMKLDATDLRYVTSDEFRVLTAVGWIIFLLEPDYNSAKVEMGSKNHEVVPTPLIVQLSGLRSGGINKLLGSLAHRSLVSRVQNMKCMLLLSYLYQFVILTCLRRWLSSDLRRLWLSRLEGTFETSLDKFHWQSDWYW